jgi:hypothetical protein
MPTPRERFRAVMNFEPFDRLPLTEWASWWDETIARWHGESLPPEIVDRYEIQRFFGLEPLKQGWLGSVTPELPRAAVHGGPILRDMADYERWRPCLFPLEARSPVDPEHWRPWAEEQARGEAVLWYTVDGFFWFARKLLGIEPHLCAFHDQPELLERINTDLADWIIAVTDRLCAITTPDFVTIAEDMSYNHGPMISKRCFERFMLPYYNRVVPHLKKRGILVFVDTDGDVNQLVDWLVEAGVDGTLPLERQAGTDVALIRRRHPRLRLMGGFDKMTMTRGEAALRAEFERLLPVARQGGFVIGCDHQTPPGVSVEQYRLYLRLLREYAEKAAG